MNAAKLLIILYLLSIDAVVSGWAKKSDCNYKTSKVTCVKVFDLLRYWGKEQSRGADGAGPPRILVFDNFVGKGYEIAREAAVYNSKKGVLIILVCSNDTASKLNRDVKEVAQECMNVNRPRMVIILADKPAQDSIRDNVKIYAHGEWVYSAYEKGDTGLGTGVQFYRDLRIIYDGAIKPEETETSE